MPTKPSKNFPKHSVDISEEAGVRYLHFGSDWVQGAMRIARPWALELSYTREMMAGLLLRPTNLWPRSALLIGLGAGSLAKFIYRNLPDCRITIVEINPQIEFIARVLTSHRNGKPWVMRRRSQQEMDQLVAAAGFEKVAQETDPWGIFTVSLARRRPEAAHG